MPRYYLSPNARLAGEREGGVLLDVKRGKYYSLSHVGLHVVRGIQAGRNSEGIVTDIQAEYKQPRDRVARDVEAFLADLVSKQLCQVSGG